MTYKDKNEFTETINISSNIKDNKNTIIGKFDLKDILFILIAGVVGIGVLSILLVALLIRNMFLILIVLALFEVPIVTLGFLNIHNIPVLDYIKMKSKSDNKSYRKQILKKKNSKVDKYILTICIDNVGVRETRPYEETQSRTSELYEPTRIGELCEPQFDRLEQVLNELYEIILYKNIELKILFSKFYLTIEVEDLSKVYYEQLFHYLRINKSIKYISNEDINNYETYINSLKFADKKYGKKQNKSMTELKVKLSKLKKVEETKDRYDYLSNRIIDAKDNEFIKVYKFLLYKSPFDINIFNELKEFCNITSHISIAAQVINDGKRKICLSELSFIDTFIDITSRNGAKLNVGATHREPAFVLDENVGAKLREPALVLDENVGATHREPAFVLDENVGAKLREPAFTLGEIEEKVKQILDKHHILYKEINEERVKDSLIFLMENRY